LKNKAKDEDHKEKLVNSLKKLHTQRQQNVEALLEEVKTLQVDLATTQFENDHLKDRCKQRGDQYNQLVEEYNELVQGMGVARRKYKELIELFNEQVDSIEVLRKTVKVSCTSS